MLLPTAIALFCHLGKGVVGDGVLMRNSGIPSAQYTPPEIALGRHSCSEATEIEKRGIVSGSAARCGVAKHSVVVSASSNRGSATGQIYPAFQSKPVGWQAKAVNAWKRAFLIPH